MAVIGWLTDEVWSGSRTATAVGLVLIAGGLAVLGWLARRGGGS